MMSTVCNQKSKTFRIDSAERLQYSSSEIPRVLRPSTRKHGPPSRGPQADSRAAASCQDQIYLVPLCVWLRSLAIKPPSPRQINYLKHQLPRLRSASAIAPWVRSRPIASILSPASRIPAVSVSEIGIPCRLIDSVRLSRVVPGRSVTIARSNRSNLLNRLDLPTFGRPINVTLSPSRKRCPLA